MQDRHERVRFLIRQKDQYLKWLLVVNLGEELAM